jgi:tRNA(Ile)-lysidine synthase
VAETLARTGDLLREDLEALDHLGDEAYARAFDGEVLDLEALRSQPPAIVSRVVRRAALAAGSPASELFRVHVQALVRLTSPEGRGKQVQLPGHVSAHRVGDTIRFAPTPVAG